MREHIRAIFLFISAAGPARSRLIGQFLMPNGPIHRAAGPVPRQSMATLVRNLA